MRYILEALKYDLPRRKLVFGPVRRRGTHVVVPTLQHRFFTKPIKNFLLLKLRKKYKVPLYLDEKGALSPKVLQVLCNQINRSKVNEPKLEPPATP